MSRIVRGSKKVATAIIGGAVGLVGLVMIPYPGPGWLVVFAGLAILSTEFEFAEKLLAYARGKYDVWSAWLVHQPWPLQGLVMAGTGIVVLTTLWFLNTFGFLAGWLHISWPWLVSPFFR